MNADKAEVDYQFSMAAVDGGGYGTNITAILMSDRNTRKNFKEIGLEMI